jgi:hypothetical protein
MLLPVGSGYCNYYLVVLKSAPAPAPAIMSSLPPARALPVPAEKRKPPAPDQNESVRNTNSDNKKKKAKDQFGKPFGSPDFARAEVNHDIFMEESDEISL